jgi:phosphoserine phosphatase
VHGIRADQLFPTGATAKLLRQQREIWEALKEYPRSYFVNTAGFERLVKELRQMAP